MTPIGSELHQSGYHHLAGPYWSDPTGLTWRVTDDQAGLPDGLARATHAQVNEVCALLAGEQLSGARDGIYCPGCAECRPRVVRKGDGPYDPPLGYEVQEI